MGRTIGLCLIVMGLIIAGLGVYAATWDDPNAWKGYVAASAPFLVPGVIIRIISRPQ